MNKRSIIIALFTMALVLTYLPFQGNTAELGEIDIHGFISQGYMKSDSNNYMARTEEGTFEFNELGINFSTDLSDKLRIGLQLFSRDLGTVGNNEIKLDWAFADYHWQDWLGLRVGKIKSFSGIYNEYRDIDSLRTFILLPQSVYQEGRRESGLSIQGLGIYGNAPIGSMGDISYQVQAGLPTFSSNGGVAKEINGSGVLELESFDMEDAFKAQLIWDTPLEGLKLAGSVFYLEFDVNNIATPAFQAVPAGTPLLTKFEDMESRVFSVEYTWENLVIASELQTLTAKQSLNMAGVGALSEEDVDQEGVYVSATYRFSDLFEAGAYYSAFYGNPDNKDKNFQKDIALAAKFDISDGWVLKLEGHKMDGTELLSPADNAGETDDDWYLMLVKTSFTF